MTFQNLVKLAFQSLLLDFCLLKKAKKTCLRLIEAFLN